MLVQIAAALFIAIVAIYVAVLVGGGILYGIFALIEAIPTPAERAQRKPYWQSLSLPGKIYVAGMALMFVTIWIKAHS